MKNSTKSKQIVLQNDEQTPSLIISSRHTKKPEPLRSFEPTIFLDDDVVIISTEKSPSNISHNGLYNSKYISFSHSILFYRIDLNSVFENSCDPMYTSYNESITPGRKNGKTPGNLFSSFMRKITDGMNNNNYDRLYRTSTCCFSASVPTREVDQWV